MPAGCGGILSPQLVANRPAHRLVPWTHFAVSVNCKYQKLNALPFVKHLRVPILLVAYVALLGGWFVLDARSSVLPEGRYGGETFTVEVLDDLMPATYVHADDQVVTVFENGDGQIGFQVFTQPYDGALTVEALQQEIPDLVVDRPGELSVDGESALAFYSDDPDIGETFEVWFVHDGLLYQATTYRHLDAWLTTVLETWRFR